VKFALTVHDHIFADLDRWLDHAAASEVIASLHRDLPQLPRERRQGRDENEPDVFHHTVLVKGHGLWQLLDFSVNDGWETDRLHVVGVTHEVGGRVL
jgi:hypothetical protein